MSIHKHQIHKYRIQKKLILLGVSLSLLAPSALAQSPASRQTSELSVELTLPRIASGEYQRPFVAVWLEQRPSSSEAAVIEDIALWYDKKKWLKDIRRWWRKSGRYQSEFDAFSGATRAPGRYRLKRDLILNRADANTNTLQAGNAVIYLEAVREHGDRTLLKQAITLGAGQQSYTLNPGAEIGPVTIKIGD